MKITEITIDRFRIWRNLTLPLDSAGLSVFYGPNEAGKTTLMRFVRAALYGFGKQDAGPAGNSARRAPWRGAIRCEYRGREFVIERESQPGTRGQLSIHGFRKPGSAEERLSKLLCGTREDVFEDIFAIGVKELQQLATMDRSEVAERIYGLSLGPEGRALLHAMSDVRESRQGLLDPTRQSGQLPLLFSRYEDLVANGSAFDPSRENHAKLCRERDELTRQIEDLRRRQNLAESNLTGCRHLQRCWKPWHRSREIQKELNSLPLTAEIPDALFDEIEEADQEIHTAERARDAAQAALTEVRRQIEQQQGSAALEKHSAAVQSLVEQTEWLSGLEDRVGRLKSEREDLVRELNLALSGLGEDWTADRLDAVDVSPTAQAKLLRTARSYQAVLARRGRLRRLNRRLSRSSQAELVELNEQLEAIGSGSVEEAIASERTRLSRLEDVGRLKMKAAELQQRSATIRKLVNRIDNTATVPEWIDNIFTVFGVCGVVIFFSGLLMWAFGGWGVGSLHGALAGAAIGSAGLTWFFCRLGLKNHFDNQAGLRLDDLHDEARQTESQLAGIRSQLAGLLSESGAVASPSSAGFSAEQEVELIRESVHRIAELEQLARRQQRINVRRERLSKLRGRFRASQQQVTQARSEWTATLREMGLTETVKIPPAFEQLDAILAVRQLQARLRQAETSGEGARRLYESMRKRIEEVGRRLGASNVDYQRPLAVLAGWRQELKAVERDRETRERAVREEHEKRRAADDAVQAVERLQVRRAALLASAGVTSVEELRQQQQWAQLREEQEDRLLEVRQELQDVIDENPHIALTEDDLIGFDAASNSEAAELAELELEEVAEKLGAARERLGSVRFEIETLEESRSGLSARFERGQVAGRIHRAAEEWFALQIAEGLLDNMRVEFEKSNASGTLAIASEYLQQLTQGRYTRVWAPLGKNRISVDDRLGRTFRVEQLSGGTREQLFLAIRFALVREFAEKGVELPMVMDDLFVNFDEGRTAAAVEALQSFAASGQQVLFFTCHRHLAAMFEQRGSQPVWLPGPAAAEAEDVEDEYDEEEFVFEVEPGPKSDIVRPGVTAESDDDEDDEPLEDDFARRAAG